MTACYTMDSMMPLLEKKYGILVLIFCLALLVRLLVFYIASFQIDFNYRLFAVDGYLEIAENLLTNGIFSFDTQPPLTPTSIRTPGYPLLLLPFIAITGGLGLFSLLQIIVSSIIPVLGMVVAETLNVSRRNQIAVGILLSLDPSGLSLALRLMPETWFTIFLLLALIYCARIASKKTQITTQDIALASVCLGIATLFKPTTFYLAPLLALLWITWHRLANYKIPWRHAATFLGIFYLMLTPWIIRNITVFGIVGYSSLA